MIFNTAAPVIVVLISNNDKMLVIGVSVGDGIGVGQLIHHHNDQSLHGGTKNKDGQERGD